MRQFTAPILHNESIAEACYEICFRWSDSVPSPVPGQFVTIRVSDTTVPLLRRPFALSSVDPRTADVSIIYQKRGTATQLLSAKRAGETLDLIGPLGNGFDRANRSKHSLVIAGGIGVGPMLFWASWLREHSAECTFLFGCRTKTCIPRCVSFDAVDPVICTDDGSEGYAGTPLDYIRNEISGAQPDIHLYACGPTPMLKGCFEYAQSIGAPCTVSMEQVMACGVGACMGCAVKLAGDAGYARVCTDGPVFNAKDLAWS
jgi:dihydroorotate dehydrogenase electron transfer subunit